MGFSSASLGPGNHYSIYVGEKGNQFFRDEASRPGDEVVSPRNGGGRGVASASSRDVFLLYARKMAKNKRSHYRISTQAGKVTKDRRDGYVGKLRGVNYKSTEYVLYDGGDAMGAGRGRGDA